MIQICRPSVSDGHFIEHRRSGRLAQTAYRIMVGGTARNWEIYTQAVKVMQRNVRSPLDDL